MSIDPLKKESVAGPPAVPALAGSRSAPPAAQETDKAAQALVDQVLLTGSHDARYQELQLKNERSNAAAAAIGKSDRSLAVLGQKIDALKAPLDTIVKNFPPFTPEDKARMALMRTYASIRKEIDQLTLPAPPEVVKARKALELPAALPKDASDSQIADHVAKLDASSAAVDGLRADLAADTSALLQDGRFSGLFSLPKGAQIARSGPSLSESDAAEKSIEVGRQFANVVSQGVTSVSSQFLKGLG